MNVKMRKRMSPILPCPNPPDCIDGDRLATHHALPPADAPPLVPPRQDVPGRQVNGSGKRSTFEMPRDLLKENLAIFPTVKGSVETQVDPGDRVVLLRAQLALRHPPRRRERRTHHAGKFRHASTPLI